MKPILLSCLAIFMVFSAKSQDFTIWYETAQPQFLDEEGNRIQDPFTGGYVSPQFANFDLNFNGVQDLVVYDRKDDLVMPFLNVSDRNEDEPYRYKYAPQYATAFPVAFRFMLFIDYDRDGRNDIFTYVDGLSSIKAYRNVSTPEDGIAFEEVSSFIPYQANILDTANVSIPRTDIPSVVDVDGDGDYDILSFDFMGGFVNYYRNMSMEKYGHTDSLDFRVESFDWGFFQEGSEDSNVINLGVEGFRNNPIWPDTFSVASQKHAGAATLAVDIDGDGDVDFLIADIDFDNIQLLINGKADLDLEVDSMVEIVRNFPTTSAPVDIPEMPGMFLVDVNGDGVKDMVVSPQSDLVHQNLNQIWYYENLGTDTDLDLRLRTQNFLQEFTVDLGGSVAPVLMDIDGDGDLDIITVSAGEQTETLNEADRLVFFENIGDEEQAIFTLADDNVGGIDQMELSSLRITSADLNNDGKIDLVGSDALGNYHYFENRTENGIPHFVPVEVDYFDELRVGNSTAVSLADMNGNGLPDLALGVSNRIEFYENTGELGSPKFSYKREFLAAEITNAVSSPYRLLVPVLADLNNDGNLEMLMGNRNVGGATRIFVFRGVEEAFTDGTPLEMVEEPFFDYGTDKPSNRNIGNSLVPTVGDLDGDGILDILVGTEKGGFYYFGSQDFGVDTFVNRAIEELAEAVEEEPKLKAYPNPAQNYVDIEGVERQIGPVEIRWFDMVGRNLNAVETTTFHVMTRVTVPAHLPNGYYVLELVNPSKGESLGSVRVLIKR